MMQPQQPETPVINPETNPNSLKTKAIVMLAAVSIGGFLLYEKVSQKTDSSPSDDNITPIERVIPITPESTDTNNNSTGVDNVNSTKPEKTNQPHNKYGNDINIDGYDKYISNLPTDRRDAINNGLYNIVKNNSNSDELNVQDATIREDSVKNDGYDKKTNINSGSFIVDMPSIKQSYAITYRWSSDEHNINIGGYAATIECLPADKLIYGNFDNCKDNFNKSPNKTNSELILDYLPYSTLDYKITGNYNGTKLGLNVDIFLSAADTSDGGKDTAIKKYESQAVDWIKSKKLNPDDYVITYRIK